MVGHEMLCNGNICIRTAMISPIIEQKRIPNICLCIVSSVRIYCLSLFYIMKYVIFGEFEEVTLGSVKPCWVFYVILRHSIGETN